MLEIGDEPTRPLGSAKSGYDRHMILFGEPAADAVAARLARGVCRHLGALGYGTLTEFPLSSGRRVDVIGFDGRGAVTIVEIKSSVVDFRISNSATPSTSPSRKASRRHCCRRSTA